MYAHVCGVMSQQMEVKKILELNITLYIYVGFGKLNSDGQVLNGIYLCQTEPSHYPRDSINFLYIYVVIYTG